MTRRIIRSLFSLAYFRRLELAGARSRTLGGPPGPTGVAIDKVGGLGDIHYSSYYSYYKWCSDTAGYPDLDNPLELTTSYFFAGALTGQNGFAYYDEAVPLYLDPYTFGDIWSGIPTNNALMTEAISKSSPFHAKWNGSSAILQLKDFRHLPRQLRDIGDAILNKRKPTSLLRAGADWNLLLRFGIAPFIQDLKSLLDFQDRTDNRLRDFHQMSQPGGAKRKSTVWKHDTPEYYINRGYFASHYQANAQYDLYMRAHLKSWGSVVWSIPPSNLPPSGSSEEKYLANRLANGIDITPSTLWELMPWSWLIDWFSNIGDFIDLSYNIVGATGGRYCVMHHYYNEFRIVNLSGCSFARGNLHSEVKKRVPMPLVFPEVHLPFVSGDMASVLGSLFLQRWVK